MFRVICLSENNLIFESPNTYPTASDAIKAHDTYVVAGMQILSDQALDWMVVAA